MKWIVVVVDKDRKYLPKQKVFKLFSQLITIYNSIRPTSKCIHIHDNIVIYILYCTFVASNLDKGYCFKQFVYLCHRYGSQCGSFIQSFYTLKCVLNVL